MPRPSSKDVELALLRAERAELIERIVDMEQLVGRWDGDSTDNEAVYALYRVLDAKYPAMLERLVREFGAAKGWKVQPVQRWAV